MKRTFVHRLFYGFYFIIIQHLVNDKEKDFRAVASIISPSVTFTVEPFRHPERSTISGPNIQWGISEFNQLSTLRTTPPSCRLSWQRTSEETLRQKRNKCPDFEHSLPIRVYLLVISASSIQILWITPVECRNYRTPEWPSIWTTGAAAFVSWRQQEALSITVIKRWYLHCDVQYYNCFLHSSMYMNQTDDIQSCILPSYEHKIAQSIGQIRFSEIRKMKKK